MKQNKSAVIGQLLRGGPFAGFVLALGLLLGMSGTSVQAQTPQVSVGPTSITTPEGDAGTHMATVSVTMDRPSTGVVTVNYTTEDGSAVGGSDYTLTAGAISFPIGAQGPIGISVPIIGDTIHEGDETFSVHLTSVIGGAVLAAGGDRGTITILDDDNKPTFRVDGQTVAEPASGVAGVLTYSITLSNASSTPIKLNYATADNDPATTAIPGFNYTSTFGSLTFPANTATLTQTVDVPIFGNSAVEGDKDILFKVTKADATQDVDPDEVDATGTIIDDDVPFISIHDSADVVEGADGAITFARFPVSLSTPSTQTISVRIQTVDGTALASGNPGDYNPVDQTFTFFPGETDKTFDVEVNDDTIKENTEFFSAQIVFNPADGVQIVQAQANCRILDNDLPPVISISDPSIVEGDTGTAAVTFVATLQGTSTQSVRFSYQTADGTAKSGFDYSFSRGTITFAPGATQQAITVPVIGDTIDEGDENFHLVLSNPLNGTFEVRTQAPFDPTCTIVDNDGPAISFLDAAPSVLEGASGVTTKLNFVLQLSKTSPHAVTVNYNTLDGTATSTGTKDYVGAAGTVTFPASTSGNPPQATISVNVIGDNVYEPDEFFSLNLSNPSGGTLAQTSAIGTIKNDDTFPTMSINSVSKFEGNSGTNAYTFTVRLDVPSSQTVTANYTTLDGTATVADIDYIGTSGQLTFLPGDLQKNITVLVNGDTNSELDEAFSVQLSAVVNANIVSNTGVGTIKDDDGKPTVSIFTPAAQRETNAAPAAGVGFQFIVSLNKPSGSPVTVRVDAKDDTAFANATGVPGTPDYVLPFAGQTGETITFAPGETSKVFPSPDPDPTKPLRVIGVVGDTVIENQEDFKAVLSNPTNATISSTQGTALGVINDDDTTGTYSVANATAVQEPLVSGGSGVAGGASAVFDVTLGAAAGRPVTIKYTITAPGGAGLASTADLNATPGSFTIPAGQTVFQLSIPLNADTLAEGDETFKANFVEASGVYTNPAAATGTITDDDCSITSFDPTFGDPAITGVSQNAIAATKVTITGVNFIARGNNVTVTFPGLNGTRVNAPLTVAPTATTLVVVVPKGAVSGRIQVQSPANLATSAQNFIVLPAISSTAIGGSAFVPNKGYPTETTVDVFGFGFNDPLAGLFFVNFNGTPAKVVGAHTDTAATVIVPAGATTGTLTATGRAQNGQGLPLAGPQSIDTFTVPVPGAIAITPPANVLEPLVNGGSAVAGGASAKFTLTLSTNPIADITVTYVVLAPGGAGFADANDVNGGFGTAVIKANTLTTDVLIPIKTDKIVENDEIFNFQIVSANGQYTFPNAPTPCTIKDDDATITSYTPDRGDPKIFGFGGTVDATTVTITGTHFLPPNRSTPSVTFAGQLGSRIPAAIQGAPTDTSIVVKVPEGAVSGTIEVTTDAGTIASVDSQTSKKNFLVLPAISSKAQGQSPFSNQAQGIPGETVVNVQGYGFSDPLVKPTLLKFNGVSAPITGGNNTFVTVTVPLGATTGTVLASGPLDGPPSVDIFTIPVPGNVTVSPALNVTEPLVTGDVFAKFTVNLSVKSNFAITVKYAVNAPGGAGKADPTDVDTTGGTIRFAAGQTTQDVFVKIFADKIPESNEVFTFSIVSSSGQYGIPLPAAATPCTIIDDDVTVPTTTAAFAPNKGFQNYNPPAVGFAGNGTDVVITGTNFQIDRGTGNGVEPTVTGVFFNASLRTLSNGVILVVGTAVPSNGFRINSATQLTVRVPDGATSGSIALTTTTGQQIFLNNTFFVMPVVTGFNPTTGVIGGSTGTIQDQIVLQGFNLQDGLNPVTGVKFGGILCNGNTNSNFNTDSNTQVTVARVPLGAPASSILNFATAQGDGPPSLKPFGVLSVATGGIGFPIPIITSSVFENETFTGALTPAFFKAAAAGTVSNLRVYHLTLAPAIASDKRSVVPRGDVTARITITDNLASGLNTRVTAPIIAVADANGVFQGSGTFVDVIFPASTLLVNYTIAIIDTGDDEKAPLFANSGFFQDQRPDVNLTLSATVTDSNDKTYYPVGTSASSITFDRVDIHSLSLDIRTALRTAEDQTLAVPQRTAVYDLNLTALGFSTTNFPNPLTSASTNPNPINFDAAPKADVIVPLFSTNPAEGLISYFVILPDGTVVQRQPIPQQTLKVVYAVSPTSPDYFGNRHVIQVWGQDDQKQDGDIVYQVSFGNPKTTVGDPTSNTTNRVFSADPEWSNTIPFNAINVVNTDNEQSTSGTQQGYIFGPSSDGTPPNLTVNEGGLTGQFTVKLRTAPKILSNGVLVNGGKVTMQVKSSDITQLKVIDPRTGLPVESFPVVFYGTDQTSYTANSTRWDIPITVTVVGVADGVVDGDQTRFVLTTPVKTQTDDPIYQQIDPADVRVTCKDEVSGYLVTPTAFNIAPNATKSFTVSLQSQPTADVALTFSSLNINEIKFNVGGVVTNTSTLTFTAANFDTPQTVTVFATADTGAGDVVVQLTSKATTNDATYKAAQTPIVTVTKSNSGTGTTGGGGTVVGPTTFAPNTRYPISFPLFYSGKNTTVNNVFDKTEAQAGFKVFKFLKLYQTGALLPAGSPTTTPLAGQPPSTDYFEVTTTEPIERGKGYLLITGSQQITFKTHANDTGLLPFTGTSYTITLNKNTTSSAPTDGTKNGLNMIGFPFDVTNYTQSSFENPVIVANGVTYNTLLAAVAAGVMSPNLYTTNAQGKLSQITASNRYIKANNGYFVQVYVNNVTFTLRQPS